MERVRHNLVWDVAGADVRRLARRWWAWLPAVAVWVSATGRTLPALDHPRDGWLAVLVHHSDEVWVGLPLIVGVLAGTSWLEREGVARFHALVGTLIARGALVAAAIVPAGIALGLLASARGSEYVPTPGTAAGGLAAWGSVRGAAMLVTLVAGGLAVIALMALLRLVTGSTALGFALPVAAYGIAVWFVPTTIERVFLITSEWPGPGGLLAFWTLAVSGPTLCALALANRTFPGRLRPAT
ncbi:MAG: hypothetical protein ACRDZ3_00485 [Acidimicrobiia bacterium]